MFLKFVVALLLVFGAYMAWQEFGDPYADPGEYLNTEPAQRLTLAPPKTVSGYKLFPVAWYQLDARVVAAKLYDEELSPIDLGVVWGKMAEDQHANRMHFTHGNRWLDYTGNSGLDRNTTNWSIANVHIIPADPKVRKIVTSAKPGDFISLQGSLVQAFGDKGAWSSSLSRKDQGDGACEVLYVTKATFFDPKTLAPATPKKQQTVKENSWSQRTPERSPSPYIHRPRQPTPRPEYPKEFTLVRELEIPIDAGSVLIPEGNVITLLEKSGDRFRVEYAKFEFWITQDTLSPEPDAP
ncbi:hypothetical protein [Puniceicoccus vermicola]|uniref:Uncharacterized protein n=1 Tax=Puniceicoccus vermicola TaxID=388746 RepID=A0A7X1AYS7_9BACT|nr:hypothetical protein [Puniceicoccus vermicola]MBC2602470.1 hypothetical protein [Puniceicoccus vermicola]